MARLRIALALSFVASCLVSVFLACGGAEFTLGPADAAPDPTKDAAVPLDSATPLDAAPGDAEAPIDARVDAEALVDAAATVIVYVAPTGNDSNPGLSPASAKKSIAAGLATADAIDGGADVHVCQGTYAESGLLLNAAHSLRGSYDCTTWKRTASFGYPTFDGIHATVIENGNPAAQPQTLIIGGSVPATTLVDGFAINGAASLAGTTTAVLIRDSASPRVADDDIAGGAGRSTLATGTGSVGLSIQASASPEVTRDAINGGTGTGFTGSIGVLIDSSGTPYVHQNTISGGLGTSTAAANPTSSWGVEVLSQVVAPNALANNVITACDPSGVTSSTGGILVSAGDASVQITGSQISGGAAMGDGGSSYGIHVNSPGGNVSILADRIYGGAREGSFGTVAAVSVVTAGTLTVHDSMVHAGDLTGTGTSANGINVGTTVNASIVDDTIYTGQNAGNAVVLHAGSSGTRITDTIFLTAAPGQTRAAIFAAACTGSAASIDHDLFVNGGGVLYQCAPADGGADLVASSIDELVSLVGAGTAFSDLVAESGAACDGGSGCVTNPACPGAPQTCLGSLFGTSWMDDGVIDLFPEPAPDGGLFVGGWMLAPPVPCAIARGGVPFSGITNDLYGVARNATAPTIGAEEVAVCAP